MCTVTFGPHPGGFTFTSSRDERYTRNETTFPKQTTGSNGPIVFPQDHEAKGTWIAVDQQNILCLLNGAFEPHKRTPPYAKSRGIMVLEAFKLGNSNDFISTYNLEGIEPFTLIWIEPHLKKLSELRWTGNELVVTPSSFNQPQIWSSATLYSEEAVTERTQWFHDWNQKHNSPKGYHDFHYHGGPKDDFNSIILDRKDKGTVSITSIQLQGESFEMQYDDFQNGLKKVDLRNELEKEQIS